MNLSYLSIEKIVSFFILLLPFIFTPFSYEQPKFLFYIFCAIFISFLALFTANKKGEFFIPYKDALVQSVVLYMLIVLIANLLGVDQLRSMIGSNIRHQGFLTLLASGLCVIVLRQENKEQREATLLFFQNKIFFAAFFLSLFSIYQATAVFFLHNISIPLYQGRIIGTFGNPNFLGGYLVMLLPFILWSKKAAKIKTLVSLMILLVVFLSFSRGAILALAVIWFFFGAEKIFLKRSIGAPVRFVSLKKWVGKSFVILSVLLILGNVGLLSIRFSSDNRLLIWQGAYEAFLRRPVLGYGQDNFQQTFRKVQFFNVDNAHNIFLEVAISSGIIGLIIFIYILAKSLFHAKLPIKVALIAFLIVAQFNPLSIAQIALFWFLLALIEWG